MSLKFYFAKCKIQNSWTSQLITLGGSFQELLQNSYLLDSVISVSRELVRESPTVLSNIFIGLYVGTTVQFPLNIFEK